MYGEEMKVTYVGSPRNHTFYSGFQLSPGVTVTKTDFSSIISNHETWTEDWTGRYRKKPKNQEAVVEPDLSWLE
jgi:hypothetical protein